MDPRTIELRLEIRRLVLTLALSAAVKTADELMANINSQDLSLEELQATHARVTEQLLQSVFPQSDEGTNGEGNKIIVPGEES